MQIIERPNLNWYLEIHNTIFCYEIFWFAINLIIYAENDSERAENNVRVFLFDLSTNQTWQRMRKINEKREKFANIHTLISVTMATIKVRKEQVAVSNRTSQPRCSLEHLSG